jgi:hypothetical protein
LTAGNRRTHFRVPGGLATRFALLEKPLTLVQLGYALQKLLAK